MNSELIRNMFLPCDKCPYNYSRTKEARAHAGNMLLASDHPKFGDGAKNFNPPC
jgi:hypothetical protein